MSLFAEMWKESIFHTFTETFNTCSIFKANLTFWETMKKINIPKRLTITCWSWLNKQWNILTLTNSFKRERDLFQKTLSERMSGRMRVFKLSELKPSISSNKLMKFRIMSLILMLRKDSSQFVRTVEDTCWILRTNWKREELETFWQLSLEDKTMWRDWSKCKFFGKERRLSIRSVEFYTTRRSELVSQSLILSSTHIT